MFLGDSITHGNGSDATGGYRQFLVESLPSIVPVGTSTANPLPLLAGKDHQEGHPGYFSSQLAAGLPGWLAAVGQVDAILLHAGTNDIWATTTAADAVESMYRDLIGTNPFGVLFVACPIISPRSNRTDLLPLWSAQVAAVAQRVATLPRAIPVAMPALADSDMFDDLHPNASGYAKMASAWAAALKAVGVD